MIFLACGSTQTREHNLLLNEYVQQEDLLHAKKFRRTQRQQQSVLGRILVRGLLANACQKHSGVWNLKIPENGPLKATYNSSDKEWYFSISHSDKLVVAAISDIGPIGVDVEKTFDRRDMERLIRGIFSGDPDLLPKSKSGLYRLWTLFEAYCKANFQRLEYPLPEELIQFPLDNADDETAVIKIDGEDFVVRSAICGSFAYSVCQKAPE